MKLVVMFLNESFITFEVELSTTFRDIKILVQEKKGIPADEQILTTTDHWEYKDARSLKDYNLDQVPEETVMLYHESERSILEVRQAERDRGFLEEYLDGLLSLPLESHDLEVQQKIAETKEKLGITPKNSDPAESISDYTLRRRRL